MAQLRTKPFEVYPSDMRLKISPSGLYTYPDVVVVCGKPELEDKYGDTLLNPTLLVEVLSESTEHYDRGKKFEHYRKLDSLQEYVLINQDRVHVEHFERQKNHFWVLSETDRLEDSLPLPPIGCHLAIAGVYDKVQFNVETLPEVDLQ